MEPKNEQTLNNQVSNNQATNEQPKKTWIEPELAILGVEGGSFFGMNESWKSESGSHGSMS